MRIRDFDLIRILSFVEGVTFLEKVSKKLFFVKKETRID